jgi:hypothetical protein
MHGSINIKLLPLAKLRTSVSIKKKQKGKTLNCNTNKYFNQQKQQQNKEEILFVLKVCHPFNI